MPKADDGSPATKQDVGLLMGSIAKLYDANARWKDEIISEFHVVAEDIRHDVGGVQSDRITAVEHDVLRLKKHTRLAA